MSPELQSDLFVATFQRRARKQGLGSGVMYATVYFINNPSPPLPPPPPTRVRAAAAAAAPRRRHLENYGLDTCAWSASSDADALLPIVVLLSPLRALLPRFPARKRDVSNGAAFSAMTAG
jgi:hypothetical protein